MTSNYKAISELAIKQDTQFTAKQLQSTLINTLHKYANTIVASASNIVSPNALTQEELDHIMTETEKRQT